MAARNNADDQLLSPQSIHSGRTSLALTLSSRAQLGPCIAADHCSIHLYVYNNTVLRHSRLFLTFNCYGVFVHYQSTPPHHADKMTDQDIEMHMAATPPSEPSGALATWLPAHIPYNESYENALQHAILNPPTGRNGLVILPDDSPSQPEPGISVRARDIQPNHLPDIDFHQLPLPLDDTRRIYASPLPGIRLTHPVGYLEGGPGPSSDQDAFVRDFISQHNITTRAQLLEVRAQEIEKNLDLTKERMRARHHALQHNARIEKEIKTLTDQREMELKIETRMRNEAMARRERREKKRERKSAG